MKVKTVALLVVAVGCGLFAMLGVRQAMNGKQSGVQEEKVSVLMAVTEIPVGTVLTPENVMFKDVAVALVPENAVTTEEQYADRAANKLILPDNFITMSVLGEPGVRGASMQIPKGMRIVSVKVNDTQTHSGMLSPGDRVDVLVTYQTRGRGGQTTQVRPLLEYVSIFATGSKTENSSDEKKGGAAVKNVSLLVTPEQASYVYLAERKGELSLVWRNKADDEHVQVGAIDERLMEELQGTADRDARFAMYGQGYGEDGPSQEPGVGNFLAEQEKPEPVKPEPEPKVEIALNDDPDIPKWRMQIFHGDNLEEIELELPVEEVPEEEIESSSEAGANGTSDVSAPATRESPFAPVLEQFMNLPFKK